MKELRNKNVVLSYHEKDENNSKEYIYFKDLTDMYNEPSGFTKKVRGIKLAWQFLNQIFNDERLKYDLNYHDIIKVLDEKFNLDVHTYCAVD